MNSLEPQLEVLDAIDLGAATEGLYATAHWLLRRARYVDAVCVFRAMVLVAPTDERGWLGLGECHEEIGQKKLAAQLYAVGAATVGDTVRLTVARARALRAIGNDGEATLAYEMARELARNDEEARIVEGIWQGATT